MTTITQIRKSIAALSAEILQVEAARPPREELEAQAVSALQDAMQPLVTFRRRLAGVLAGGRRANLGDFVADAHRAEAFGKIAFGLAIEQAGGPAAVVAAAAAEAAAQEPAGTLRLPRAARAAKLEELRRRRHELELQEAQLLEEFGGERRPDAGMPAILGIPAEVAAEAGLFREGRP